MRGNITRRETKLVILEDKETLTKKELQTVSKMVKKLEAMSKEFKTYHRTILLTKQMTRINRPKNRKS